jgi:FMN phosphatase YigB (HAD superfamily)
MKPKYLIFDVDNTLLDFGAVFSRGQEAAAELLGIACTAEFRALDEQCGWRAWKECRLDDTHLEEVQQHYHEYYYQYVKNHYAYLLENLGLSFDVELLTQNYLDCAAAISTPAPRKARR